MTHAAEPLSGAPRLKREVMIYPRFERFWHWSQAALIFFLIATGFVVHGTFGFMRHGVAAHWHVVAGVTLMILWVFMLFWQFTTGEWHNYAPKAGLWTMVKFYGWGILTGAQHPFHKSLRAKQNALQTMAYLGLALFIGPLLWATGVLYATYPWWSKWGLGFGITPVAFLHTAGAFLMIVFVIGHVYIITTGRTAGEYLRQMITGYDEVELDPEEVAWLESHHGAIRKPKTSV
jgi:thiosulfate reductase cytochrome b subunit